MAMVKISNGEVTQIVSRGAYESQYKMLGFEIVGTNKVAKVEDKAVKHDDVVNNTASVADDAGTDEADGEVDDEAEDTDDFEELLEKPLSQWTNEELKSFVNAKNIDTSSARKTSEVRSLVKNYLDNEAKNAAEA